MSITITNPAVHQGAQPGGPVPQRASAPPPPPVTTGAEPHRIPASPTAPAVAATPVVPQTAESAKALRDALSEATQVLQKTAQGLEFSLDKDLGRTVVKVIDSQTREVLRQIPDTEVLHMAKAIDKMRGLLVRMVA